MLYKRATTDANGQFNLIALAPGEYNMFAWENLPNGAELNAEFMKDYDDRGIPVAVTAGAQIKAQLPLISAKN